MCKAAGRIIAYPEAHTAVRGPADPVHFQGRLPFIVDIHGDMNSFQYNLYMEPFVGIGRGEYLMFLFARELTT